MSNKYVVVSGAVFGLVALGQVARASNQVPVHVGGFEIPVWTSWVAAAVAGCLCVWAVRARH